MTSNKRPASERGNEIAAGAAEESAPPAWSDGLKQLYDNIVDEPLPDAFMDLLSKLDEGDDSNTASDGRETA